MPTKLQKVKIPDGEELRRTEPEREACDQGREKRDDDDREQGADERRGERRRERLAGPTALRHRMPVEGAVATDHGSPGMLNSTPSRCRRA